MQASGPTETSGTKEPSGPEDALDEQEALRRNTKGAPKKAGDEVAQQHWTEFAKADGESLFFGAAAEVKRRFLIRWGNSCRADAAKAKTLERRQLLELCAKRFQIMEERKIKTFKSAIRRTTCV